MMMIEEYSMRLSMFFFFQAEAGIRDAQESRGLGDVYKRQVERTRNLIRQIIILDNIKNDLVTYPFCIIQGYNTVKEQRAIKIDNILFIRP